MVAGACVSSTPPQSLAASAAGPQSKTYDEYLKGVKARIHKAWDLSGVLKAHDPERVQLGVRDRLTILDVTLDAAGAISAMKVSRPSGLAFLDDEAFGGGPPRCPVCPSAPCASTRGRDGALPGGLLRRGCRSSLTQRTPVIPAVRRDLLAGVR
jgi:hypothetical protein